MADPKLIHRELAFKGRHVQVRLDRIVDSAGNTPHAGDRGAPRRGVRRARARRTAMSSSSASTGTRRARDLLEICAGGLNPGEDPIEAARRELEEETGYLAGKLVERARFWTTPGFTTEFMYLYEATDLVKTQTNLDEDEIIDVEIATQDECSPHDRRRPDSGCQVHTRPASGSLRADDPVA